MIIRLLFIFFLSIISLFFYSGKEYSNQTNVNFTRDTIVKTLQYKIKNNKPLVVHLFVPLCDNVNQGIVPVNASLGNGMNLKTNLYWGAGYGIKSYFKNKSDWKFIESKMNVDSNILERIVLKKTFTNGANVFMVADAYRGDRIKECMVKFLNSISGNNRGTIKTTQSSIGVEGNADLLIFNGHNGLMDMHLESTSDLDSDKKDAAVIACMSYNYFKGHLSKAGAYPLVTTSNFMAPEAYVSEGIINSWAMMLPETQIRESAAKAYDKYQKCGLKGALRLFKTGW